MCGFKRKRFRIIEIDISSVGVQSHPFGLEDVLKSAKRIVAIQAFKVGEYARGPISGKANANATVFNNASLVLGTNDGDEPIFNMPLTDLCSSTNNGLVREFDVSNINPSRCKIYVSSTANLTTNEVFVLGFHYE